MKIFKLVAIQYLYTNKVILLVLSEISLEL